MFVYVCDRTESHDLLGDSILHVGNSVESHQRAIEPTLEV